MEALELLSQIALTFIKSDNFDFKIKNTFNKIGNYFKVSRIYVFLDNEDGTAVSNIYEWCNDGIVPQIDQLQDFPYDNIPSWKNLFFKEKNIYHENVEDLPSDIGDILTPQGIFSIIINPLYVEERKYGFIGFDLCQEKQKWSEKDEKLLETILTIIAAAYKDHFLQKKRLSLIVIADISDQVLLTKKVEKQKNKLQNIIEGSRLGTWEWEISSNILAVNERFVEIFGYIKEELMPIRIETWARHTHLEGLKKSYNSLKRHFEGKSEYYTAEFRMKHKNGSWVWILSKGKVIKWDSDGKPAKMFGTHSDITEKKQLEEKIKEISIRDSLTNTYNRRYVFEQLDVLFLEFLTTKRNFIVSIIDIDYFKNINDKYGHQIGDFILKDFSQIIKSNIKSSDLFGRYGGEEFIIVSKNTNKEKITLMIERILDIIKKHEFKYYKNKINLTFSCGISECKEIKKDKISVEKVIERADKRLYMAKNKGRNRIINFN